MYPACQSMLNVLEISTAVVARIFYSCMSFCGAHIPKHTKFAKLTSSKSAARFEQLYFMPRLYSSFLAAGILGNGV